MAMKQTISNEKRSCRGEVPGPRGIMFLLGSLVLLAAGLRLYELGRNPLWYDEAMYTEVCKTFHAGVATSQLIRMEPAFYFLLWAWERFGHGDAWLRMHAVLAGVAAVAVASAVGRRMAGWRGAAIAGAITAAAPILVFYSRDAKMYSWVILLSVATAYCAVRYADSDGARRHLAGYAIAALLLFHMHELSALFLAFLNLLYAVCFFRQWRKIFIWCAVQAAVAAACLPYLYVMHQQARTMSTFFFWAPPPRPISLWYTVCNMTAGYAVNEGVRIATVALLLLFVVLGLFIRHPRRKWVLFFLLLGAANILGVYILSLWAPWSLYVDRYLVGSAPLFLLAAVPGIAAIRWRTVMWPCVAAILCLDVFGLRDLYAYRFSPDIPKHLGVYRTSDSAQAGAIIRQQSQPGDAVWHVSWEAAVPVRWYAPELPHRAVEFNGEQSASLKRLAPPEVIKLYDFRTAAIETAQAQAGRVWLFLPESVTQVYAQYYGVKAWLDARARHLYGRKLGGRFADASLDLYAFDGSPTRPAPPRTASIQLLGDQPDGGQGRIGTIEAELRDGLELAIQNQSETIQRIYWQAVRADLVCDAAGFDRPANGTSRWGLQLFRDRTSTRMAWYGRFSTSGEIDDPLEYPLTIPPGTYDLFVERYVSKRPGGPASAFRLHAGNAICVVSGAGDGPDHWEWVNVGTIQTGDEVKTVRVEPFRNAPKIEISPVFSRIVFLKHQEAGTAAPVPAPAPAPVPGPIAPVFAKDAVIVPSHAEKRIPITPPPGCGRVDIILSTTEATATVSAPTAR